MKKVFSIFVCKKLFISLAVCAVVCSNIFAFDYGAVISNDTTFKSDDQDKNKLKQYDIVSLWLKTPVGKDVNNYIAAEGMYKFKYLQTTKTTGNYLDLNLLKFAYLKSFENGTFNLSLGRFAVADSTGLIFAQNADGVFASYEALGLNVSLYSAYTGLLNGNIVEMNNSPDFEGVDETKVYSLADKNVVAMLTVSAKNLFANQTLTSQALASFSVEGNTYNRIYGTVGLSGPIVGKLLYDVKASYAFIAYNGEEAGTTPFVKAKLGYYFDKGSVAANAVYAGKNFVSITNFVALNSVVEPGYSDMLKVGLSGTYKPESNLLMTAFADLAFDGQDNYAVKGFQYGISTEYQIWSDFCIGLNWVQYFDINKTDFNCDGLSIKAKISL